MSFGTLSRSSWGPGASPGPQRSWQDGVDLVVPFRYEALVELKREPATTVRVRVEGMDVELRVVATVVAMVADGMSPDEIVAAFPDLERADVAEALRYAAEAVRERRAAYQDRGLRFLVDNALSQPIRWAGRVRSCATRAASGATQRAGGQGAWETVKPSRACHPDTVSDVDQKVLEETKRFRVALPKLLENQRGKWVVFMDGEVKSVHDDAKSAYDHAVATFGPDAPYLIAPVVETSPTPVTAAVLFGLSYA